MKQNKPPDRNRRKNVASQFSEEETGGARIHLHRLFQYVSFLVPSQETFKTSTYKNKTISAWEQSAQQSARCKTGNRLFFFKKCTSKAHAFWEGKTEGDCGSLGRAFLWMGSWAAELCSNSLHHSHSHPRGVGGGRKMIKVAAFKLKPSFQSVLWHNGFKNRAGPQRHRRGSENKRLRVDTTWFAFR